jgi:LAO/AO transport system kinase
MLASTFIYKKIEIPVIQTIADQKKGIDILKEIIINTDSKNCKQKDWLLVEKIYQLIQKQRMRDVDKSIIFEEIQKSTKKINLYQYVDHYKI